MTTSIWRDKYKTLKEYYSKEFNSEYFEFDSYELTVDPDETIEQINEYSIPKRKEETLKCALSFPYFCTKYVKIMHPKHGLVPFRLFKYQKFVINEYENNRFNIIRKFRQGGLTTVSEIWALWRCLFKLDQQIMLISKTDVEAIAAGEIINTCSKYLPIWLQPSIEGKWNDHHKQFYDTGGNMYFGAPERARGRAITYLLLDEAAFIPDMDRHWKAIYPIISTGGNCIVISTVNGMGNWYADTYHRAVEKKNSFNIIDLKYTMHPEYNDPQWVKDQKANLGEKGWLQEVIGSFLNSGETYISSKIISNLQELVNKTEPKRKKFKKWCNTTDNNEQYENDGALWIWKEPKEGHDYIIGVDAAEGAGDEADNSVFEVIDSKTLEQVAEFYSNLIPPYLFAQVLNEIATYYNHALIVVESNGHGGAVLSNLQHDCHYENLHYEDTGKKAKAGIRIGLSNRSIILESMQHRLMNETLKINSRKFVKELNSFIYNVNTQKAEAKKGSHDDAIMAVCIAIYVRDSILRDSPIGIDVPTELQSPFKSSICEEIKKEIMEDCGRNFQEFKAKDIIENEEMMAGVAFSFRKKNKLLLDEFGW